MGRKVCGLKKVLMSCIVLLMIVLGAIPLFMISNSSIAHAQSEGEIDYVIDYVPIENVEVVTENNAKSLKPGELITLGVNIDPWYAEMTVKSVQYFIYENGNLVEESAFAKIVNGNGLQIFDCAIDGNVAVVAVAATYTFEIEKIPVERASFTETNITVEQGAIYDLPLSVSPKSAYYREIKYFVIEGEEYLEYISGNKIKINSFIGRGDAKIILSAEVDGIICDNQIELSIHVPVDKVTLIASATDISLGGQITFTVGMGFATASEYDYTIVSGEEFIESFQDDRLTIKSNISAMNPQITLYATCENVESELVIISIIIPLEGIIIDLPSSFVEGDIIQLGQPIFIPNNSSFTKYQYSIIDGNEYASITKDGYLKINESINASDAYFTIIATETDTNIVSDETTISIIVPIKSILLTANKSRLTATSKCGDVLELMPTFNDYASYQNVTYVIDSGDNYIEKFENNSVTIKANVAGGVIKLHAESGNVKSNILVIEVYVPVESITFNYSQLNRGEYTPLVPNFNINATDKRWIITSVEPSSVKFDNNIIFVPDDLTYGTGITVNYKASEEGGITGSKVFTVAKLAGSFSIEYSKDSSNYIINPSAPQLEVGKSVTIIAKYNGRTLPSGLSASIVSATNATYGNLSLCAQNVAGGSKINYTVRIKDGSTSYEISNNIEVFRRLTGQPSISEKTIYNKTTTLNKLLGSLDSKASNFSLAGLKFVPQSGYNYELTENGVLTMKTVNVNPSIQLTMTQKYNGYDISYTSNAISVPLKIFTVYKDNGTTAGPESVVAVNNVTGHLDIPTRRGYIFGGYYAGSESNMLWDSNGNRTTKEFTSSYSVLYAKWTAVSYTLVKYQLWNGEEKNTTTIQTKYGQYHGWSLPDYGDWTFEGWYLSDESGERKVSDASSYSISTPNIKENGTSVVKVYTKYSKGGCVATGTQITLADGSQKAVEDLDGTELLLVWNLFTGKFDSAPIIFIDSEAIGIYNVINLHFSDGTVVKTIAEHGYWNYNLNQYVMLQEGNASNYIGDWFAKETLVDGLRVMQRVQLINVTISEEETRAWSPVTFGHLCYFVNGMLSMPGATEGFINIFDVNPETMQYDEIQMKLDILKYGLFTYEDFADILPYEMYEAFGGDYLKVSIGKGLIDMDGINALIEHYAKYLLD